MTLSGGIPVNKKGILTVISGFSGSGKGTVVKELVKNYGYVVSVSATTRTPRAGERNGEEYFFISREDFEQKIKEDGFLEHAEFVGNYYGTPALYVDDMLNKGRDVILEIEVNGGLQVHSKRPDTVMIFMVPPSADELKNRLIGRGTENMDKINKRLARAYEETQYIDSYDYVVVNDDINACTQSIHDIILNEKKKVKYNSELRSYIINDFKRFERR